MPGVPNGGAITLADLAGMQSGLADYSTTTQFAKDVVDDPSRSFTEQELVNYAIPGSPKFKPGAQYEYGNTNTVQLGLTSYEVDIHTGAADRLPFISPTGLAGCGGMVSTLDDMQTWGLALGDGRLIGAELQLERVNRARLVTNGPEYDSYGLGIGILDGWWGHTGSAIGFQAAAFYDPATQATIAVLVNSTPLGSRTNLNVAEQILVALADVVATR